MTRDGTRMAALAGAAIFAVAALASCGGGNGDSTSGSTANEPSSQESAKAGEGQGGKQGEKKKSSDTSSDAQKGKGTGQSGGSGSSKHYSAAEVSTPLEVSGGGSGQFRVKGGGDNSVQEYGDEVESELNAAAEATHGFFVARAVGDWSRACSYLSQSLREQLTQVGGASSGTTSCAKFLAGFTPSLPAKVWREITTIDAGSLRREGEQGFLIYYGAPEKTVYAMPLKYEGGEWKVGALSGDQLPGAS